MRALVRPAGALTLAYALMGPLAAPVSVLAADETVDFASDSPEMNAAIQDARRTLDDFLELHQAGQIDRETAALKVAVPTTEGLCCEHLWMSGFTLDGGKFTGLVANDPVDVNYLKLGQAYQFARKDISDWNYQAEGKLHGAYTLRVMLPRLAPDQAAKFRAMLAPLP
ncbi:MAG: YegJ family protein [Paracoccaceae bacterium]